MKLNCFFLFSLFLGLKGSQNEQIDMIRMIITYKHDWIGFTDSLNFRKFIHSFIVNEELLLPTEFRGRKFLLFFLYNEIKILRLYFSLVNETIAIKKLFDLLEDIFQIFFTSQKLLNAANEFSEEELHELALNKTCLYEDAKDTEKINNLKQALSNLLLQYRNSWIKMSDLEACEKNALVERIAEGFKGISLSVDFFYYFSNLKFYQSYLEFGFIEHGTRKVLKDQLDKQLYEFAESGMMGNGRKVLAAIYIYRKKTKSKGLPDYVGKLYARNAIMLVKERQSLCEMQYLDERDRLLQLSRSLFIYYSKSLFHLINSKYVSELCTKLKSACDRFKYDTDLFSTFHEICYERFPNLFKDLISHI
jgi:hypothetical protein